MRRGTNVGGVQRLFSMFPRSAPGYGLLLLRLSVATMLHVDSLGQFAVAAPAWRLVGLGLCSFALGVGFLTPYVAALAAAVALSVYATSAEHNVVLALAALNAIALALLGPGAYSLDARLFGRRMLVMRAQKPDQP
jgi:uncharacterized membrane protein YphA (DoxX/SURF4 family)